MLNLHRRQLPDPDDQLRRTELAIDQLERADLYVVQAVELDLESPAHSRALRRLRADLQAALALLRRPQPAG